MKRTGRWVLCMVLLCGVLNANDADPAWEFRAGEAEATVVAYTLHRGNPDGVGATISGLYAALGKARVRPGGTPAIVSLNNPALAGSGHSVIEVRVPIGKPDAEIAGRLPDTIGIKTVPATPVVEVRTTEGATKGGGFNEALLGWAFGNGYVPVDDPWKVYPSFDRSVDPMDLEVVVSLPVRPVK